MADSAKPGSRPSKPKRWGLVISMTLAGIVAVAIASYIYVTSGITRNSDGGPGTTLEVSGEVNAGSNRMPVSLLFKDEATGETENVSFEGTHYQIDLPNGNYDWQITVLWQASAANGDCDGGNFTYQRTNNTRMIHDVSCQT